MKKSELYNIAMDAVLDSGYSNEIKLEVLAELIDRKGVAEYSERVEEEKNG